MLTIMSGPDPPFDYWGYLLPMRGVPLGVTLVVSVWFSVVTCLILINYYVTGFMVIHQLVVIALIKFCQHLKANAVESANLRAS